jgi:SAM-dependent methyltransferase
VSNSGALRKIAAFLPLRWIPVDALLRLSQWSSYVFARISFLIDWRLQSRGLPNFYKHETNLARWTFEPHRWSFTARGVYAREHMVRGCKVLDLCCGDGSYSYLFFSDIAARVDGVDFNSYALKYARKYHALPNIGYHELDILAQPLPNSDYDVVVWNAAICFFPLEQIDQILRKIIAASRPSMKLIGMLPKANGFAEHLIEFEDCASVERLLSRYFAKVSMREVDEGSAITFYFHASAPL